MVVTNFSYLYYTIVSDIFRIALYSSGCESKREFMIIMDRKTRIHNYVLILCVRDSCINVAEHVRVFIIPRASAASSLRISYFLIVFGYMWHNGTWLMRLCGCMLDVHSTLDAQFSSSFRLPVYSQEGIGTVLFACDYCS